MLIFLILASCKKEKFSDVKPEWIPYKKLINYGKNTKQPFDTLFLDFRFDMTKIQFNNHNENIIPKRYKIKSSSITNGTYYVNNLLKFNLKKYFKKDVSISWLGSFENNSTQNKLKRLTFAFECDSIDHSSYELRDAIFKSFTELYGKENVVVLPQLNKTYQYDHLIINENLHLSFHGIGKEVKVIYKDLRKIDPFEGLTKYLKQHIDYNTMKYE